MSFNISAWSIKKPVPVLVMFMIMTVVGLMSFGRLGIDSNPNIDIPIVSVTVTQPGAGPVELESQVTKKVEDAVAGLGNIDELSSTVTDGVSTTVINFVLGTDTDRATNDVRNAVSQIRQELPQDVNDPIVQRLEFAGGPIMTYAVVSERRSVEELSDLTDRTIARALLQVSGVAQVNRLGGSDREIRVNLNPKRLQALGITATDVNNQIRAFNINLPGGRSDSAGVERNIRTLGSAPTVDTLKSYGIILPSGESVPLESLAQVEDGVAEIRQSARYNGQPVVTFSVLRSSGSTLVSVEEGVREAVAELEKTLPEDIKLELIFTRANSIRESYQASIDSLILGCVLTTITVWIFLRDWRATFITGAALPLSIIPTFAVMQALNYTLNGMTLLSLSLAVGNLVDDAICMIENIDTHLNMGKRPFQAALDAALEIGLAVVATTATIVAVFLPVAFMGGVPGQFFQPFGVTFAVSTMFSTLVATTVVPMLSAYLLKSKPLVGAKHSGKSSLNHNQELTPRMLRPLSEAGEQRIAGAEECGSVGVWEAAIEGNSPSSPSSPHPTPYTPHPTPYKIQPYRSLLSWALKHRITTLLIAIAFFIGSLQLVPYIPKGLFDNGDIAFSTVNIELPPGSTLQDTETVAQRTTALLQQHPAVNTILETVGGGGSDRGVNKGVLYVNLVPKSDRPMSQKEFEQEMRSQFTQIPGARISFASTGGAGGQSKDLSIVLKSNNPQELKMAADALEIQMRQIPGLVEVSSSASLVKPEILIKPDPKRAADLGVSVQAIARTASLATIGDIESNLAKFDLSDRQIPIRVQLAQEYRDNLELLKNLQIPSQRGTLVPLSAVADITLGSGPAQIQRFDRSRQVTLAANLQGLSLGEALEAVRALPAMNPLPSSVEEQPSGNAEIMQDIFGRFLGALSLAVLCIYAILVLLYNNFFHPFTILVALPLSIGGALLALLITQKELGLFALIGIVLLMGLVTKNAILLVDCSLANQEQGLKQFKAVLEAGVSRLRPIFMTTISTVAGMMPIALELGAGGEVRSPMAIAVLGGFSTSTLLTLVIVPVLFTYIDGFQRWFFGLFTGKNRRRRLKSVAKARKKQVKQNA
ncbi:efflux RND transporter permease subunit [Planktothricoides raciborskii]|uniref:Efflux RND transporter permease subunit n=1 Tax=Planktothricoides raciborskii GIHE-MW2 TaxID=2792601 RepID=A0AAU8JFL0_9CYAN